MSATNYAFHGKGPPLSLPELREKVGETFFSDCMVIDQARIDAFADVSDDHQFLHVDPVRAAETPFGTTIAHGFLTLSMLSRLAYSCHPAVAGVTMSINYGFDRLRFLGPVPSGSRLQAVFTLAELEERRPGEVTFHWDVEMQVDGAPKPVLAARWITRRYIHVSP
ncbi:MAG: MaoC family dehydratase [Pseudomonadota bacterium]